MTLQNSINAPTPTAVNKGGTGNTTNLSNNQIWVGNGTTTPDIVTLTSGVNIEIVNSTGLITINTKGQASWETVSYGGGGGPSTIGLQPFETSINHNIGPGPIKFLLPGSANFGDMFQVVSVSFPFILSVDEITPLINFNGNNYATLTSPTRTSAITLINLAFVGAASYSVVSTNGEAFIPS